MKRPKQNYEPQNTIYGRRNTFLDGCSLKRKSRSKTKEL